MRQATEQPIALGRRFPDGFDWGVATSAYRFSIAWPRVFPEGGGQPNSKGLDFYSRLVDALLAAGIEPLAMLYHWDLPQTLQDRYGGWQSKEPAKAFADYAGYAAAQLGDQVKHYFTSNAFASFVAGAPRASTCRSAAGSQCTSAPPQG
ncbi:MAG TPA: family 1 glycosylhydrolase [Ktedonobacterales bacterium]|jgi:beta-glucosidase|nr:family 1 glycosylhydrolase [Ktedonobacterales bacterium]